MGAPWVDVASIVLWTDSLWNEFNLSVGADMLRGFRARVYSPFRWLSDLIVWRLLEDGVHVYVSETLRERDHFFEV